MLEKLKTALKAAPYVAMIGLGILAFSSGFFEKPMNNGTAAFLFILLYYKK